MTLPHRDETWSRPSAQEAVRHDLVITYSTDITVLTEDQLTEFFVAGRGGRALRVTFARYTAAIGWSWPSSVTASSASSMRSATANSRHSSRG